MKPLVLVFSKAPAMGRSKTRLARDIGAARAWQAKRVLDRITLRTVCDPRWLTVLAVADRADLARHLPTVWPAPTVVPRWWQGRGNLGDRMQRLIRRAGGQGRTVLAVGTDCPGMTRADVAAAGRGAARHGAVAGPADDGGYWLLALSHRLARRIDLSGVRWSGPHALADTLACLPQGIRPVLLQTRTDIDTGRDWIAWCQAQQKGSAGS